MSRSLVLLSGEGTTIPEAEARALFLAYDPASKFASPERRVLVADSLADPFVVGSRVAFSRRVGLLIDKASDARRQVAGTRMRLRKFDLSDGLGKADFGAILAGLDAAVDLKSPDYEFTLVRGRREYLALTKPGSMRQGWLVRRPRARPFFHPTAIFPKLSRAIVNLTRFREGDVFLDPFCGTGSLALEAYEAGAEVVVSDQVERMVSGALANMRHFGQRWVGAIRADAFSHPVMRVDAVAADLPYGRASSTRGEGPGAVVEKALDALPGLLPPGSRMVLMHSKAQRMAGSAALEVEEEHDLYIHKLLTRTITVLRRK
jgi:tRNA (guanine10-N2)-dimethyltransferase